MKLKRIARNILLLQTDNSTHLIFIMQQEVFSNKVTLSDIDMLMSRISCNESELLDTTEATSGAHKVLDFQNVFIYLFIFLIL